MHFGNTTVADVLVATGAVVGTGFDAAGVGAVDRMLAIVIDASHPQAPRALRAAAVNDQLDAIDALLALGVPVGVLEGDAPALHWAAWEGKAAAVRHLVEQGADPTHADPTTVASPSTGAADGAARLVRVEVTTRWRPTSCR